MQESNPLAEIYGGRVLDLATGAGQFVATLLSSLKDVEEVVGVDHSAGAVTAAARSIGDPRVRFEEMDILQLSYADASFDVVGISCSLHHLNEAQRVVNEALRVLKTGGHMIVLEMYADQQRETQQTQVLLHHWWGEVDTALGVIHNPTWTRAELEGFLRSQPFAALELVEHEMPPQDPHDAELISRLEQGIDQYQKRIVDRPDLQDLVTQGEELRSRLQQIGVEFPAALLAIGRK